MNSELFNPRNFPGMAVSDLLAMREQFKEKLNDYCNNEGCTLPNNDLTLPPPARAELVYSQEFGGRIDVAFEDPQPANPMYEMRKVMLYHSIDGVYSFRFYVSDGLSGHWTEKRGEDHHRMEIWEVPTGESVTQIELWHGFAHETEVAAIRFITNKGNFSPKFGDQNRGANAMIYLQGKLVGVRGGTRMNEITRIQFLSNKIIY
jgi:hypothetical protein